MHGCIEMRIEIPTGDCQSCRFFSETEDGDRYCAIYNKFWEISDEEAENDDMTPPAFCTAVGVEVLTAIASLDITNHDSCFEQRQADLEAQVERVETKENA